MRNIVEWDAIWERLQADADPRKAQGMARVGISVDRALGVPIPNLRALAREMGRDHARADRLWREGWRETRILAAMTDDPALVTVEQMDAWAGDFPDWEVCDQTIQNLFEKTLHAWERAVIWAGRDEEFVKRAGFVLMARLAVSDKKAPDAPFLPFLELTIREADDDRAGVKKAVNWAVRQIGKRNPALNAKALAAAEAIRRRDSRAARWVAADAIRELTSEPVQRRLAERAAKLKHRQA